MVKSWKLGLGKRERERKKKKKTDLLLETLYAGKRRQSKSKKHLLITQNLGILTTSAIQN